MGSAALVVAAGWSVGVATAAAVALPLAVLAIGAVAAGMAAFLVPSSAFRLLALGAAAMLLGQVRVVVEPDRFGPDRLAGLDGTVVAVGRVAESPTVRGERTEVVLRLETVEQPAGGPAQMFGEAGPRVLVRMPGAWRMPAYGDRLEITGRLGMPRSRPGWPLAEMLARRSIGRVLDAATARTLERSGSTLTSLLLAVRERFEANTRAVVPEPHASLVGGIVFGARASLPSDLKAAMTATGTTHLTAVSGANVAMVAGALVLVLRTALGPGAASLVAMAGVWVYTLLVGAPPSALRAAAMATCALAAFGMGRQPDTLAALALACAALLAWDPGLSYDVGFQLSVAATAGLVLLTPSLDRWLGRVPAAVRGPLVVALAAQLATLPIIVGTFHRVSLVSLPANVLAAPAVVPIMVTGAALAGLGWVPGLGDLLGWVAWLPAAYLLTIITTAAALPGAEFAIGRPPVWLPVGWYAVLLGWAAVGSADLRALGIRPAWLAGAAAGGVLVLLGALFSDSLASPGPPVTRVSLLDTDPPAVFLRTLDGDSALVLTDAPGFGLAPAVWALADFDETTVGAVIGPDGVRHAVDLLALRTAAGSAGAVGSGDDDEDGHAPVTDPGARYVLAGGAEVVVLDRRMAGDRPVLDLVILAGGVSVLLPGPGQPSDAWRTFEADGPAVAVLPSSAVSWARLLPEQSWLALVGEQGVERVRGDLGVLFLGRREYGQVDLEVGGGGVAVRSERCPGGRECHLVVPPPVRGALIPRP